jgi:hypothetical protein
VRKKRLHLSRDLQFFIRRHDPHLHPAPIVTDTPRRCICGTLKILRFIERDAEEIQSRTDSGACRARMLTDAARERDRIDIAEDRRIGADVFSRSVRKAFQREASSRVATIGSLFQVANIATAPGQSQQPAATIEQIINVARAHLQLVDQVKHQAGIDVAGARAHHQAFHRSQAHAGVDAAAVANGAEAGPVAEMTRDEACAIGFATETAQQFP